VIGKGNNGVACSCIVVTNCVPYFAFVPVPVHLFCTFAFV